MDELTKDLIERTGMEPEQAREVSEIVIRHLVEHLPDSAARAVAEFAAGPSDDDDGEARRKKATIAGIAATTAAVNAVVLPGAH
jgi:hypothetical protein